MTTTTQPSPLQEKNTMFFEDPKNKFISLESKGTIPLAERHSNAHRPLKLLIDIDKHQTKLRKCPCCHLPVEKPGIIQPFSFCDPIFSFSSCGIGSFLYFFWFRYIIIVSLIIISMSAIPTMILSPHYSFELMKFCSLLNDDGVIPSMRCAKFTNSTGWSFENKTDWVLHFTGEIVNHYNNFYDHYTGRKEDIKKTVIDYNLLNFLTLLVLFMMNIMFTWIAKTQVKAANIMYVQRSSYSLLIENLGKYIKKYKRVKDKKNYYADHDESEAEKFKHYLIREVFLIEDINQVVDINLCYNVEKMYKLKEELQEEQRKLLGLKSNTNLLSHQTEGENIISNGSNNNTEVINDENAYIEAKCCLCCKRKFTKKQIDKGIEAKQKNIEKLIDQCINSSIDNFSGAVFVTFDTIEHRDLYLKDYPQGIIQILLTFIQSCFYCLCCCCISAAKKKKFYTRTRISVYPAPEPEDIVWANMNVTQLKSVLKSLFTFAVSGLIIVITGCITVGLNYAQYHSDNKFKENYIAIKYGVSFLISITLSIVNQVLTISIRILTNFEKKRSMTDHYLSYSIKVAFYTFINTAILPYVTNVLTDDSSTTVLHETFLNNILFVFLSNSILTPILWLVNTDLIIKWVFKYIHREGKFPSIFNPIKTQRELNLLYELPEMDLSAKYSYIMRTIAMSVFYLPIFPLGAVISFIGFLMGYIIEKFKFTRLYKRPEMVNHFLCMFYLENFALVLFAYGVGNWIFFSHSFGSMFFPYFNIIFYGVMILIPLSLVIRCDLLGANNPDCAMEFNECVFPFQLDYKELNPITREISVRREQENSMRFLRANKIDQAEYEKKNQKLASMGFLQTVIDPLQIKGMQMMKFMKQGIKRENKLNKEKKGNEEIIDVYIEDKEADDIGSVRSDMDFEMMQKELKDVMKEIKGDHYEKKEKNIKEKIAELQHFSQANQGKFNNDGQNIMTKAEEFLRKIDSECNCNSKGSIALKEMMKNIEERQRDNKIKQKSIEENITIIKLTMSHEKDQFTIKEDEMDENNKRITREKIKKLEDQLSQYEKDLQSLIGTQAQDNTKHNELQISFDEALNNESIMKDNELGKFNMLIKNIKQLSNDNNEKLNKSFYSFVYNLNLIPLLDCLRSITTLKV